MILTSRPPANAARRRLSPRALAQRAGLARRGIQIGPRIRVGGTVGKIGESLKQNLGQAAKFAAVPVSFVNPALGAALAVGGRALHTNEGAAGISDLAGAGLKNYATGKIGGAALSGLKRAVPALAGAVAGQIGGGAAPGGGADGTYIPGGTGDLGTLPDGAAGGIDWMKLAGLGLGGYQAYNAASAAGRAGDLEEQALARANELWDAGAPLRAQGLAGLTNPRKVDLSSVYTDPTNPFARSSSAAALSTPAATTLPGGLTGRRRRLV